MQVAAPPLPRLVVSNIPQEVPPDFVLALLREAGNVIDFQLAPDPQRLKPHAGVGHVVYDSLPTAGRAIQMLNGRQILGRALRLEAAPAAPFPMPMAMAGPRPPMLPPAFAGAGAGAAAAAPGSAGPSTAPADASVAAAAASVPGMPASIRSALSTMSPAELWSILNELKAMAVKDAGAVRQLLVQYPMLAHAVVHIQAISGNLRTPTVPYVNAALASGQPMLPASRPAPPASAATAMAVDGGSGSGGAAAAAAAASPAEPEDEQKSIIKNILAMSDAAVAALPADKRAGVEQIRAAMHMPPDSLPPQLLQLREQLHTLLSS